MLVLEFRTAKHKKCFDLVLQRQHHMLARHYLKQTQYDNRMMR